MLILTLYYFLLQLSLLITFINPPQHQCKSAATLLPKIGKNHKRETHRYKFILFTMSSDKPKMSSQMDAVMRLMTGQESRTIADKISDSNRPTWDQYKQTNADKLNISGLDQKKMEEYRKQLDEERDARLKGGTNHRDKDRDKDKDEKKKHRKKDSRRKRKKKRRRRHSDSDDSESDSSSEDSSVSSEDSHRRRRRRKKHHRKRAKDDASDSDSRSDEESRKRRKKKKKHKSSDRKHRKDKKRSRKDDDGSDGENYKLSNFFNHDSD
jgi:hypothetical protein